MRILQVIPVLDMAGAETMCQNLSVELHKMGHDVLVICLYTKETPLTANLRKNGVPVAFLGKKTGLDIRCFYRLYRVIRKFQPDVVHSHIYAGKYAHLAASAAGVKVKVYTVHNIAQKEATPSDQKINRFLFRRMGVVPVALSEEVRQTIVDVYHLNPKEIPIACNGIPMERCNPCSAYQKTATNYIHVGRFCEVKNHANLIRGFVKAHEQYPTIQLRLYGDGPLRQKMENLVAELQAQDFIHFMGLTDDVYSAMAKADVFILPSIYEGMPMTLIEAMATGLPIITTPVGGIVDMLEDGKEAAFTGTDPASIAEGISSLVENLALRQTLGQAARIKAKQFSAEAMAKKYLEIYSEGI